MVSSAPPACQSTELMHVLWKYQGSGMGEPIPDAAVEAPQPLLLPVPPQRPLPQHHQQVYRTLHFVFIEQTLDEREHRKSTGLHTPYTEVLFRDGSLPSVAIAAAPGQPGRAALPPLLNVDDISNLSWHDAGRYLINHAIVPVTQTTIAR
ncbi:hypothetical protein DFH09DRAFT_1374113 [Mycena vulgaris]|nr:hypothetical protein DFH09DRAFT_1374113 [Mycena vulgaris]